MIERGGRERKRREPNDATERRSRALWLWKIFRRRSGRGIGIGVVVEPPFVLDSDEVDVRWPGGQCFES